MNLRFMVGGQFKKELATTEQLERFNKNHSRTPEVPMGSARASRAVVDALVKRSGAPPRQFQRALARVFPMAEA